MIFRFTYRALTEVSPRLNYKALRLWVWKGLFALRAYQKRLKKGELFPPFLFFALTNACNLRCRGCWIATQGKPDSLDFEEVDHAIRESAKYGVFYHTLLGGEPFLYPRMWELIEKHPECFFQIITNGEFLDEKNVARIRKLGNITPLISIDGSEAENDQRRGEGSYQSAIEGARRLQKAKVLYGVATVATGNNVDTIMNEEYVQNFIDLGAMYLWYYIFRSVGPDPAPELCVGKEKLIEMRKRLLQLRRKMPIILIDTYWTAQGKAVCPAAKGLGFHIGPRGGIEPCPPLSVAKEFLGDHQGDLFKTINESEFLRNFQNFVHAKFSETTAKTGKGSDSGEAPPKSGKEGKGGEGRKRAEQNGEGCVILEDPKGLAEFFEKQGVVDTSGRDFLEELKSGSPKMSHRMDGEQIPEDFWLYKILKKTLFFGMGGYG